MLLIFSSLLFQPTSIDATVTLQGQETLSEIGSITPICSTIANLVGNESTSEIGTIIPECSANIQLIGQESISEVGSIKPFSYYKISEYTIQEREKLKYLQIDKQIEMRTISKENIDYSIVERQIIFNQIHKNLNFKEI